MLRHEEAQELHRITGQYIEAASPHAVAVMVSVKDLERARELAAMAVADTMKEGGGGSTPQTISLYVCGDEEGPNIYGLIYDEEDAALECATENDLTVWRVPFIPQLDGAVLVESDAGYVQITGGFSDVEYDKDDEDA